MAEYPPRSCGPCPNAGHFEKKKEANDYFTRNTTPEPVVKCQEHVTLTEDKLGVPSSSLSPDLRVSPVKDSNSKNCPKCLTKTPKPKSDPCPESEHNINKQPGFVGKEQTPQKPDSKGDAKQPLKGILKKSEKDEMKEECCCSKMEAKAGSPAPTGKTPPLGKTDPSVNVPVPDEPKGVKPPCYLPQPQDDIMLPMEKEMGPIGPWATGRVDWGPLAGMTGTRPVVDKYSITRFSEGEWRKHNKEMLDMANIEQHKANLIDWNGRRCLEQAQSEVDKNQADSTKRLLQREQEIHRWKCELERAIAAATEEVGFMEEQRNRLKQAMSVLMLPESIARECLDSRTARLDPELCRDEVEEQLIRELALTAEIRDIFTRTLKDLEKQMVEDKTAKQRLETDWSDKQYAHEIESINVALNNRSTILLFRPGATIFPEDQSSSEYWEHYTREILQEGEATRQRSVAFRGTLDAILLNAARDLRSQADKVELALTNRIACTDQVRIFLENELKKVLQRLADVESLISDIRDAIRRLDAPMKKAQTRLDNRLLRPRVENCRDEAHFGLIEEVKSIGENIASLVAQLKQAESSQASLIKARSDLEKEIMVKRKTLEIDGKRTKLVRSFFPSATALAGH